jgi:hypothetical protein
MERLFNGHAYYGRVVPAAGMDEEAARAKVRSMHGESRVPTLLRAVDRLCRDQTARAFCSQTESSDVA